MEQYNRFGGGRFRAAEKEQKKACSGKLQA